MQKILLYYKFTPISDPEAVKLWQKNLTDVLNLMGRILVSRQGWQSALENTVTNFTPWVVETARTKPPPPLRLTGVES